MLSTNYLYVNYITCVPSLGGEFTSMTIQAWSINLRTLFPNLSGIVRIANRYFVEVIKKCITNVKSIYYRIIYSNRANRPLKQVFTSP